MLYILLFFISSIFPLLAEEGVVGSYFLFKIQDETLEELADRFSTTPDTLRGNLYFNKNGNRFPENSLETEILFQKGSTLSLPDSPPFVVQDLGSEFSLKDASLKLSIPESTLHRLNYFSLKKNGGKLKKFVVQEKESFWFINRKKYEWGLQSLGSFFLPIYCTTILIFLGGVFFILKKFQFSESPVITEPKTEKKESPFIVIEVLSGNHKGKRVKIESLDFTVGREEGHNHALTLEGESRVSGKHLRIHLKPDGWVINDLGSSGGTLINKRDITRDTKIAFGMIVELGFGGVKIKLEPFTPEVAKAHGAKSTTEIRKIAREESSNIVSKKTKILTFTLLLITIVLIGFGYKTKVLEERISLTEENIKKHEKGMEALKSEIDFLNARMGSLEESQKETQSQLRNFSIRITEISKKTEENTRGIKNLQERIDKLPSRIQEFQKKSVEFSNSVRSLNQAVLQKESEEDVRQKSEIVKQKFESLKLIAGELQIDMEEVEKSAGEIEIEPKKEEESGVKIVDLLRGVKKSMRGVNPILIASFDILHSLVDNKIVLSLAPIVKETGVLGVFGFLI